MISIPIFNNNTYFDDKSFYEQAIQELYQVMKIDGTISDRFNFMWNRLIEMSNVNVPTLLNLSISIYNDTNPQIL